MTSGIIVEEANLGGSLSVAIANGEQESTVIDCTLGGLVLCGVLLPAAFTSGTISFEACDTKAGTFVPIYSTISGTLLQYSVTQGTYCAVDPKDFCGIQFLKIKSGSSEGGARTLICSLKGF